MSSSTRVIVHIYESGLELLAVSVVVSTTFGDRQHTGTLGVRLIPQADRCSVASSKSSVENVSWWRLLWYTEIALAYLDRSRLEEPDIADDDRKTHLPTIRDGQGARTWKPAYLTPGQARRSVIALCTVTAVLRSYSSSERVQDPVIKASPASSHEEAGIGS
ncbi:hypothetical protein BD311DRAFT_761908 [Dichomitus squalens]|uniref:Uncharacterized protein n=1 Tax=Dichomitus squalens TaxID=114155 RepID=A0A4Q9MH07_9APHY|nr:hypothetical protein BD311DRAFT_761908 [Dichomitus squalens]